ncbi:ditrans,polycis-polyprenyl diphosphate synthase [(2E,6E)-farnesydiphosphate specific] [Ranunculus cassubicifolius]
MLSLQFLLPPIQYNLFYPKPKLTPSIPHYQLHTPPKSHPFLCTATVSSIQDTVSNERVVKLIAAEEEQELILPLGLKKELLPNHIAVIMDGNVRWAKKKGWPSSMGHEAGVHALRNLIELCCTLNIRVLTVFAFSSDNWQRPKMEVDFLMSLFERGIQAEAQNFMREDIKVSFLGDSSKLPNSLQKSIANTEKITMENTGLHLIVAVSYSGKYDVVQACQNIAYKVKDGLVQPEDINEELIEQELETNCTEFPYPDLLIRTSGELRVSNFLLWQLAYTELCFVESLWPDFGEAEFVEALRSYQQRQRRYGRRDL